MFPNLTLNRDNKLQFSTAPLMPVEPFLFLSDTPFHARTWRTQIGLLLLLLLSFLCLRSSRLEAELPSVTFLSNASTTAKQRNLYPARSFTSTSKETTSIPHAFGQKKRHKDSRRLEIRGDVIYMYEAQDSTGLGKVIHHTSSRRWQWTSLCSRKAVLLLLKIPNTDTFNSSSIFRTTTRLNLF